MGRPKLAEGVGRTAMIFAQVTPQEAHTHTLSVKRGPLPGQNRSPRARSALFVLVGVLVLSQTYSLW